MHCPAVVFTDPARPVQARTKAGKLLAIGLKNHDLTLAVKQVFGSWHRAMIVVDVALELKPPTTKWKWSPERIIECIRLRHQEGKPVPR